MAKNGKKDASGPEQFGANLTRLTEDSAKMMSDLMARMPATSNPLSGAGDQDSAKVLGEVWQRWMAEPAKLAAAQTELAQGYMTLWTGSLQRMMGMGAVPVVEPAQGDNRFKDPEWSENPYYDFWKQAYLLTSRWSENLVSETDGIDAKTRARADFYLKQMIAAASPSNFPFTNPEVMRETMKSNGDNLVKGLAQFQHDLGRSDDLLKISQTDTSNFKVGVNMAIQPGKVVFRNAVIELLQYAPSTPQVYTVPILIVPPWINKFYILDLAPQKSFIKHAVDAGFTVFVVSWVNPDESHSAKTFEDYIGEGILAAADAVTKQTGVKKPNVLGYCVGGTLLGTTLAWLAAKDIDIFKSATFLTAQLDFTKAGELLNFIDDEQLKSLEEMMAESGFLDGSRMATVFNMLRPQDLIWPYVVNNYMLGKKPMPFDLLFWNQDSTRMPAANHLFYLREFYLENKLAKGEMTIAGERLDLSKITLPVYELATREDHIAPAASVFLGAKMLGGKVRFVLAGSGHIAGVVNPPGKVKYQHWTGGPVEGELDDWIAAAKETPGSWWPDWHKWLGKLSGKKIAARNPAKGPLKPLGDAPGTYVLVKS